MSRPENSHAIRDALISTTLQSLVLLFIWFQILINPNSYFFAGGGDGIKNYYTPMYYLKYGKGTHFGGMHYPFGDNVVFSDNQPLLSWLIKPAVTLGLFNPDFTIALLNIFMLLSIVVCACYLSLLLSYFNVRGLSNVLFSVSIATLSPQVLRFLGHYALAYSCFIPMLWYYLLRYNASKQTLNKYAIVLILILLSFSFIHLYYALMASAFILLFGLLSPMVSRTLNPGKLLGNIILALIPIISLSVYQWFSESVYDRLAEPYGITTFVAKPETIFLPLEYNVFNLNHIFGLALRYNYEGLAFVGYTGTLFLLYLIFRFLKNVFSKRDKGTGRVVLDASLKASLIAAVLILIFSFGIPVIWNPDFFLSLTPTLRQFRSLGRFAWIFYYVFNVFAAVYLYQLVQTRYKAKSLIVRLLLVLIIALGWLIDGIQHQVIMRNIAVRNKFTFDFLDGSAFTDILKTKGFTTSDFQAAVVLPFFHVGSEKFYIENNSLYEAFKLSYATGLPLVNTAMSRTSVSQTAEIISLLGDTLLPKPFFNLLNDHRPLLLLSTQSVHSAEELYLLNHSKEIYKDAQLSMYALYPDSFVSRNTLASYISHLDTSQRVDSSIVIQSLTDTGLAMIKYRFKNDSDSLFTLQAIADQPYISLLDTSIIIKDSTTFNLSFWMHIDAVKPAFPYITINIQNMNSYEVIIDEIHPKTLTSTYRDRLRINYNKHLLPGNYQLQVLVHNKQIIAGNMIIRDADTHIKQQCGRWSYFDNYPIMKE